MSRWLSQFGTGAALLAVAGCSHLPWWHGHGFSYGVSSAVKPSRAELPGLSGGPPRPVAAVIGPNGRQQEFVANEVVFRPKSPEDLQAFLARYSGTVLRDGAPFLVPDGEPRPNAAQAHSGDYLIRVDVARSDPDDVRRNMSTLGVKGRYLFSSEDSVRLAALVAREAGRGASPNVVFKPHVIPEHPDGMGGHVDAETWWWMTEDDDPAMPGDQGRSVGVVRAWRYLQYHGLPPTSGTWRPPIVAILDDGFALDPVTGVPLNDNVDYWLLIQADVVDHDFRAGGPGPGADLGSRWHGQGAFGVAAARPRNQFGGAGTGGVVARPMLVRVGLDAYTIADGIRTATINGADVISVSIGGECYVASWVCGIPPDDIYATLERAALLAASWGSIVVAGAGNDSQNLDDDDKIPCETATVICVGAIGPDGQADSVSNFGGSVDIWAPTGIFSTIVPETAGNPGTSALLTFSGTSAATPFVAGIVALMRALDPMLFTESVREILRSTANPSTDPKVSPGYVDALRAVLRVRANQPPTVTLVRPPLGASVPWQGAFFRAQVLDWEPGSSLPVFDGQTRVTFSSNRDGDLCTSSAVIYMGGMPGFNCSAGALTLGVHTITATARDPFDAAATTTGAINVINRPPAPDVIEPAPGATFFSHQSIQFGAFVPDPDETIPNGSVTWASSIDGSLGAGWSITRALSVGAHTVTVTAVDGLGATGQDNVAVTVLSGAGVPSAQILAPAPGTFVGPGTMIVFQGVGTDPEDGTLPGTSLQWSSDVDGLLGTGNTLQRVLSGPITPCNPESVGHTVTLRVTDSDGNTLTELIRVYVGVIC
jgi:Subtilase family